MGAQGACVRVLFWALRPVPSRAGSPRELGAGNACPLCHLDKLSSHRTARADKGTWRAGRGDSTVTLEVRAGA